MGEWFDLGRCFWKNRYIRYGIHTVSTSAGHRWLRFVDGHELGLRSGLYRY
jgi:hypothetical protein